MLWLLRRPTPCGGACRQACARRETAEETDLRLSNVRYGAVNNARDEGMGYHYVTIFMVADAVGDEIKNMEPDKCEGWEWVKWAKVDFPTPLFTALANIRKEGFDPLAVA